MKRLSLLTLIFAILSVLFSLLLIFFRFPFPPYPLMSVQDVLDILTPLVLIPVYWLLYKASAREDAHWTEDIVFMVLAAVWVEGQGLHLSANSINNLAEGLAKKQVIDILGTSIYQLTYFFDEHLSHYMWHIGIVGLAALLLYREWRRPAGEVTAWRLVIPAGLIYGFTLFCIFLEGQTVPLGLPFVVIVAVLGLLWGRQKLASQPLLAFFFIASLFALVLFAGWGIYFRGFPQFTDVGLF
ncbi:MAG: hypothetical protein ABI847_05570 [Anaerolineales bacterium]